MDDDIITDTGMDQQKPPSKVSRPALQCLLLTQLETKSLCTSDVPTLKGSKANPASASDSKNPNLWSHVDLVADNAKQLHKQQNVLQWAQDVSDAS